MGRNTRSKTKGGNTNVNAEKERREKENAERQQRENAQRERTEKENAERQQRENAERERTEKENAERQQRENAERESRKKENSERQQRENAQRESRKKENVERQQRQQREIAERESRKKENGERKQKENSERERKQNEDVEKARNDKIQRGMTCKANTQAESGQRTANTGPKLGVVASGSENEEKDDAVSKLKDLNLQIVSQIKETRDKLKKTSDEKAGLLQQVESLQIEKKEFLQQMESLNQQGHALVQENKSLKEEINVILNNQKDYEHKIYIAEAQLKEFDQKLKEEIEKEKESQTAEMKKMELRILGLQKELEDASKERETAIRSWQAEKDLLSSQLSSARNNIEQLSVKNTQLTNENAHDKKEEDSIKSLEEMRMIESKMLELERKLQDVSIKKETALRSFENEKNEIFSRLLIVEKENEQLIAENTQLANQNTQIKKEAQDSFNEKETALSSWEADKNNILSQLSLAEKKIEQLTAEIAQIKKEAQDFPKNLVEIEEMESKILYLEKKLKDASNEKETALSSWEADKNIILKKLSMAEKKIEQLTAENAQNKKEAQDSLKNLVEIESKILDLKKKLQDASNEKETALRSWEADKNIILSQLSKIEQLTAENAQIKKQVQDSFKNLVEIEEMESKILDLEKKLQDASNEKEIALSSWEAERNTILSQVSMAEKKNEQLTAENAQIKKEAQDSHKISVEIEEMESKILHLKKKLQDACNEKEIALSSWEDEKNTILSQVLMAEKKNEQLTTENAQIKKEAQDSHKILVEIEAMESKVLDLEKKLQDAFKEKETAFKSWEDEKKLLSLQLSSSRQSNMELAAENIKLTIHNARVKKDVLESCKSLGEMEENQAKILKQYEKIKLEVLSAQDESIKKYNELAQREILLTKTIEEQAKKIEEQTKKIESLRNKMPLHQERSDLSKDNEELRRENWAYCMAMASTEEQLTDKMEDMEKTIERLSRELAQNQERFSEEKEKLMKQNASLVNIVERAALKYEQISQNIFEMAQSTSKYTAELGNVHTDLVSGKSEFHETTSRLKEVSKREAGDCLESPRERTVTRSGNAP